MSDAPQPSPRTSPGGPVYRLVVLAVLLAIVGVAFAWWWQRPTDENEPPTLAAAFDESMPGDPVPLPNPGYVGAAVCGECHAARLAEFTQTRHYRACWTSERGPMPPAFTGDKTKYTSQYPGIRFQFDHIGNDYLQTLIRDTPQGPMRSTHRIDLVYGAGGMADEVYFTWKDDQLRELPAAWLGPSQQWGEQPFNPLADGDFTRTTTPRCLECHNTWVEHIPGTENRYRRESLQMGVTCEKCHGPGRDHVTFHRTHPGATEAQAVVHPGQLTRDRQTDLCAQCHSNAMRHRSPAFTYRPGEPLDTAFRTLSIQDRERDHVADQTRYMKQSKCYQKSDTLTCVSCHDPHRPPSPAKVRGACLQCHEPTHCREQERLPAAVRNDCVSCHMPEYYRIAVRFNTTDDKYVFPMRPHEHRIAVYPAAKQEVLLNWYRSQTDAESRAKADELAKWLGDHWLAESDRLHREKLFMQSIGAAREAVRLHPTAATRARLDEAIRFHARLDSLAHIADSQIAARRFPEAIRTLEEGLTLHPRQAKFHEKLGTLYAAVGKREQALERLQSVAKCDPDNANGYHLLGQWAYQEGRLKEAAEYFRRADEINPFTAEANFRWGLALLGLEQWREAATRFRQALAVNPNHAGAAQGLSHTLRMQGQNEEAVRHAHHAARLTGFQNPDVLMTLVEALAATGRVTEAITLAGRAQDEAGRSNPAIVPRISQRLRELRDRGR